jgi:hypothetical protein
MPSTPPKAPATEPDASVQLADAIAAQRAELEAATVRSVGATLRARAASEATTHAARRSRSGEMPAVRRNTPPPLPGALAGDGSAR